MSGGAAHKLKPSPGRKYIEPRYTFSLSPAHNTTSQFCLGPLTKHTTYEAEGLGVVLALELL